MKFNYDTKIARFKLDSLTVQRKKKEKGEERIVFSVNDITFTTTRTFPCERDFLDAFLNGEKMICNKEFLDDPAYSGNTRICNVFLQDGNYVFIVVI